MKKRIGAALLFGMLLIMILLAPSRGIADLGDFSGGSDYGGSDWGGSDWGGGSDWDSSDWGDSDGSLFGLSLCAGGAGSSILIYVAFLVLIYLVINTIVTRKSKQNRANTAPGARRTPDSRLTPMSDYQSLDPNFSEEALKEHLSNLYLKMQDCCTKRDVEPIRPYFADSLYQQFERQMRSLKGAHRTNYVERIAILDVQLRGFYQENGSDVIIAELYTRITDYTLDDETGEVVSGSRTAEKFMTYEYALSRPSGKTTDPAFEGVSERHCPNCGAPLSVNESIKCPYCGSVLTFSDHEWTVYAIKGISQRTQGK